jgi:hypothetical protein
VRRGLIARDYELEPVRVKSRYELRLSLSVSAGEAGEEADRLIGAYPKEVLEKWIKDKG